MSSVVRYPVVEALAGGWSRLAANIRQKILNFDELRRVVEAARAENKTIVQCHGCFDIVHPGHIRYLEFARRQGDVLIVSLTGDLDVGKGADRPYIPQELRAENLAALMVVDYVYINPMPTAEEVLRVVRPDCYVKGREYECSTEPGFLAEKAVVESGGGRIIFSSGEIVFSSSELIGRMPKKSEAHTYRLGQLCARHEIDRPALEAIVDRFRDLNVLVVGDVIIDRYVLCDVLGVAGEGPMLSLAHRDERCYVGGAAIVARHAAALGARAFLLSAGTQEATETSTTALEVLARERVETHFIESRSALVEKTRFLADDQKLFKLDKAQRIPLDSVAEKSAAMILEQQSKIADAVIFCDFGYGAVTASLLARVLPTLRKNVPVLAADVSGGRGNLLNFRNVDLLCPTEREVRQILNDHDSGLSSVAWNLLQKTQARHLFVTLEKRGMLVFERANQQRDTADWSGRLRSELIPAFADYAVDHLGCGDALLAASTLALAAGASLTHAAYLGNAAAAIEVGQLGNHPVESDRLREWLSARSELIPSDAPKSVSLHSLAASGFSR
ncbi:MAG: adenylyltransferase/cytidyltransferase family protein [Planctomycetes bacterium]|nr:adenylyltransferase/cytidyltransferase family protein [Planctomycetota bacterium]MBI3834400.1 adenylyltransferase/cytidyltransferase family protein [Planctomycetota bacterium]